MAGSSSLRSSMRGGRTRRAMSDINVVPYIEVMLVLLVIFMVTAPLVAPSIVNLPTRAGALDDGFHVDFLHFFADFPVHYEAAVAIEDRAQEVEGAGDIEVTDIDMPVLVRP